MYLLGLTDRHYRIRRRWEADQGITHSLTPNNRTFCPETEVRIQRRIYIWQIVSISILRDNFSIISIFIVNLHGSCNHRLFGCSQLPFVKKENKKNQKYSMTYIYATGKMIYNFVEFIINFINNKPSFHAWKIS